MFPLYSTCAVCTELLAVIEYDQRVHPGCEPHRDRDQDIADRYRAAVAADDTGLADELEAALIELDQRKYDMLRAALAYTDWGWPVFPLRPGRKDPFPRSNGCKDATTDRATVTRWWRATPDANIGLATGHLFDVLDVDAPEGTLPWAAVRDTMSGFGGIHGVAATPGGGLHAYLPPRGEDGNFAKQVPGLDYRGRGGYVVAPPSRSSADGLRYAWSVYPSPKVKSG